MSFLQKPQSLFWRKALFQVHLWSGIVASLYVILIGVTGSVLVFRDEAQHASESHLRQAANPEGKRADLTALAERLVRENPQQYIAGVYAAESPEHSIVSYRRPKNDPKAKYELLYFHPATGAPLGQGGNGAQIWAWIADLHFNLLAGPTGRIFNGIGAAMLLLLCLTGIVIWWPGLKRWKRGLQVDFTLSWKRINWDLHSATGFWTLAVVSMWALTGVYFAWPNQFRAAVNYLSPLAIVQNPLSDPKQRSAPPPSLRQLVASAQAQSPSATLYRINLPTTDTAPFRVYLSRKVFADVDHSDVYYFDQYTGRQLAVLRRGLNRSAGDVVMSWIGPLHFGTFGGIPVKLLWVLLGLAPPLLTVTGLIMYWNRSLGKKWRSLGGVSVHRGESPAQTISVATSAPN
jgi:uncharacterized iron-regulated membrane protein